MRVHYVWGSAVGMRTQHLPVNHANCIKTLSHKYPTIIHVYQGYQHHHHQHHHHQHHQHECKKCGKQKMAAFKTIDMLMDYEDPLHGVAVTEIQLF